MRCRRKKCQKGESGDPYQDTRNVRETTMKWGGMQKRGKSMTSTDVKKRKASSSVTPKKHFISYEMA